MDFIAIPTLFYGTSGSVKKHWRKYIKTAWSNGDWGQLLQNIDMTLLGNDVDIWVSDPRKIISSKNECWRLYALGHELRNKACNNTSYEMKLNSFIVYDKLLLSGMDYFWFTLGLMYTNYGFFYLEENLRNSFSTDIYTQYFSKMAKWIPELIKHEVMYRGHLAIDRSLNGVVYPWQLSFITILQFLGWHIADRVEMIYDKTLLMKYMRDNSIIEMQGEVCYANKILPN